MTAPSGTSTSKRIKFLLGQLALLAAASLLHIINNIINSTSVPPLSTTQLNMQFFISTMAFVAAATMGAIATAQDTVTVTVIPAECTPTTATLPVVVVSTTVTASVESISSQSISSDSISSITNIPISSVTETASTTHATFVVETPAVESVASTSVVVIASPVESTSNGAITSTPTSSKMVSPVATLILSASPSSKSASATASGSGVASATVTSVPSNDATVTGMVGKTVILTLLAASLFNLV
ncbi:hypothetical protein D6D19_02007 [Aureobasidium pullulans]|uniref:Uncharacterized protein n=2 Tax=Aureobasidium pullulans TaxID=5580 RepID=A0A074XSR0_AURPU|nr:uncharacterized protein M438DRAFT_361928 [Aureobasidium pullulans EXF-150]THW77734.1 hypothetical protein D6D19_02007 [Aureobasidium pullulans]KEQ88618.1 hypothetical protein M438DRAFT_361928 [Aureobasidium pullulans EXF-150]THY34742.1 hypothetical protein D6D00_00242 [Aureobasidium pullulans]THZ24517.1 hypothetical protein D6C91_03283 [Aureobasidium pullulans]TIA27226.1 hypothetical protein D6C81_00088 [Aureobasidium pullulans]